MGMDTAHAVIFRSSFSRTAVNFSSGSETLASNIAMSITVFISLQLLTEFVYYTPKAILASIILSALPGLIDLNGAYNVWKVDKLDFVACMAAFFGLLFSGVETSLLAARVFFRCNAQIDPRGLQKGTAAQSFPMQRKHFGCSQNISAAEKPIHHQKS
ncbi:Sulfate transporter 2.2 [Morus notabilis]|uniref:Sulfate transporter 2.2 n=1 Tax=Morus notabilis TaxID=981085 RepID=W9QL75_9ROSA|nr:Sulfate transporter 2.2 [Morus notabilis]